ncbi:hypothetical protein KVT40_009173 [Elsinoe batatas]|uniref:Uncharacterized protein n=1 Tax=Elsinoe batatas TaxID=2601811 RepID=A0A8K0PD35_9PEZI|nr:hypothetical protein KVT40_009173 [Elsinoe batatas]
MSPPRKINPSKRVREIKNAASRTSTCVKGGITKKTKTTKTTIATKLATARSVTAGLDHALAEAQHNVTSATQTVSSPSSMRGMIDPRQSTTVTSTHTNANAPAGSTAINTEYNGNGSTRSSGRKFKFIVVPADPSKAHPQLPNEIWNQILTLALKRDNADVVITRPGPVNGRRVRPVRPAPDLPVTEWLGINFRLRRIAGPIFIGTNTFRFANADDAWDFICRTPEHMFQVKRITIDDWAHGVDYMTSCDDVIKYVARNEGVKLCLANVGKSEQSTGARNFMSSIMAEIYEAGVSHANCERIGAKFLLNRCEECEKVKEGEKESPIQDRWGRCECDATVYERALLVRNMEDWTQTELDNQAFVKTRAGKQLAHGWKKW